MTTRREFLAASLALAAGASSGRNMHAAEKIRFSRDPFSLGIASGYPTSSSVVLWTRLAPSPLQPGGGMPQAVVPVQWEVAVDEKFNSVVQGGTTYATPDWAHSIHVEPQGLESGRHYWYRFTAGGARSIVGRTRTAPAEKTALSRVRLAVASCQQYEHGYFNPYRHMLSDELDLIVHVGDYIYEQSWGENRVRHHNAPEVYTLDDYRARYALYKSDPDLLAVHAAYPWLLTWDDHEVDNDYAGGLSEENDEPQLFLARRAAAYRAYYEHMPLPARMIPFGPDMRLYAQQSYGDLVSINMLDQRQYRAPEACPRPGKAGSNRVTQACAELTAEGRTMLGTRQESWLAAGLTTNRKRWNLLAQGTVMSHIDEDPGPGAIYWTDGWNGYPAARTRLMRLLREAEISNPVVLSGDIHAFIVSGLRENAAELDGPVIAPEIATTSISSHGLSQSTLDKWRAGNPNLLLAMSGHRGYTRIDITRDRLQADLIAVDSVRTPSSGRKTIRSIAVENANPQPQGA